MAPRFRITVNAEATALAGEKHGSHREEAERATCRGQMIARVRPQVEQTLHPPALLPLALSNDGMSSDSEERIASDKVTGNRNRHKQDCMGTDVRTSRLRIHTPGT